jgi:uncharacterized protein YndB with AHSA1/START domain
MTGSFTIAREIAASPERVWAAFTDAGQYAAWIWPADWKTECEIEPRVGGGFRVASGPKGMEVHGTYIVVEPITRLALTWRWRDDTDESLVTITLEPTANGTRLVLTHENFANDESRAAHEQGWSDCLDRLPGYLLVAEAANQRS